MGIFISHSYSYDSRSETCEVFLGYTKPAATSNKLRIIRIGNRAATSWYFRGGRSKWLQLVVLPNKRSWRFQNVFKNFGGSKGNPWLRPWLGRHISTWQCVLWQPWGEYLRKSVCLCAGKWGIVQILSKTNDLQSERFLGRSRETQEGACQRSTFHGLGWTIAAWRPVVALGRRSAAPLFRGSCSGFAAVQPSRAWTNESCRAPCWSESCSWTGSPCHRWPAPCQCSPRGRPRDVPSSPVCPCPGIGSPSQAARLWCARECGHRTAGRPRTARSWRWRRESGEIQTQACTK